VRAQIELQNASIYSTVQSTLDKLKGDDGSGNLGEADSLGSSK
jgi:hypothetical protein